jgi:hypothetical protein
MNRKTVLIIVGIVAALCCCVVVAGVIVFTQAGKFISQTVSMDPTKTEDTARTITDYTLPNGYKAGFSMSLAGVAMAAFTSQDDTQTIMLFQAPAASGMTAQQMEEQMRQAQERQSGQNYQLKAVGTQTAYIRGESTEFTIYEGENKSGIKVREIVGAFNGKGGTAILMVVGPVSSWNQDEVDSFIKSLR